VRDRRTSASCSGRQSKKKTSFSLTCQVADAAAVHLALSDVTCQLSVITARQTATRRTDGAIFLNSYS